MSLRTGEFFIYTQREDGQKDDKKTEEEKAEKEADTGGSDAVRGFVRLFCIFCFGTGQRGDVFMDRAD